MSEKDSMDGSLITQETIKRLARDVRQIKKSPLISNGIYYHHDEENMLKGYAMIIGPSDTVYANGYYFFEFNYPYDYPSSPPKVIFRTNQEKIRFNPNLYTNGKVCISILNTWRGDQWSSCQTISSILLTLCTLFTNEPLLNEPGINRQHRDFNSYNRIVEYANIDIAMLNIVEKAPQIYLPWFDMFYNDVITHFKSNLLSIADNILDIIKKSKWSGRREDGTYYSINIYGMKVFAHYGKIVHRFNEIFANYATPEMCKIWKPIEPYCRSYTLDEMNTEELLNELLGITTPELYSMPPTPKKPSKCQTVSHDKSSPPPTPTPIKSILKKKNNNIIG